MTMIAALLSLGVLSFLIAWFTTWLLKPLSLRLGFVDRPGHRKIHAQPIPLGGGISIVVAFVIPMTAVVAACGMEGSRLAAGLSPNGLWVAYIGGVRQQTPLAMALLAATLLTHFLGLWDDRKAVGPYLKLLLQLAIVTALVLPFRSLWALSRVDDALRAHGMLSILVSVFWIVAITNAFNFLDNMDGLSAGVAAVCATAFLVATISIGQWFVAACLALLIGALLGFLCFNFAPASIFMGDSGSLVIGLLLGVLTIRTTYLPAGVSPGAGWYSVFVPVIVLAVPLYDLVVVTVIRLLRGKSPFVGDTNHFSHRLVVRGMSKRTAVLCLYLISAATAVAAIILRTPDPLMWRC